MRTRRVTGLALALLWLGGCEDPGSPGAPNGQLLRPDGGLHALDESASCGIPDEGCACRPGEPAVPCYDLPEHTDEGMVCRRGTRTCRGGEWSACESLREYSLVRGAALVAAPSTCNPCDPTCFTASTRPTDADLTSDVAEDVQYYPGEGGIGLLDESPTGSRGAAPAVCGDGVVEGLEECDDGNTRSLDGCELFCRRETGWECPRAGGACWRTTCGDGVVEGDEECDDANPHIGDGCTPFCDLEPSCSGGTCTPICGDGDVFPGEACDDGNTLDGDGCSSTCSVETGFMCEIVTTDPPPTIDLPIVYRDLRESHPDFQNWCCGTDRGMVEDRWGPDRKPVPIIRGSNPSLDSAASFFDWYNDSPENITIAETVTVTRRADGTYEYDDTRFFPLDGRGWTPFGEPEPRGHNFHFTSEVRFWFRYERGQQLRFRGDDDVWVFINGHLAVDIGGVHGPIRRSVTLDATTEGGLGLTPGGFYEAAVFQAERHTTGSNYRLTLAGFFFGRTECTSVCGDGIVTRAEICDDGVNDGRPGGCMPDCSRWAPSLVPRGRFSRDVDSGATCLYPQERPVWGDLSWDASTPSDTSIRFEIRTADTVAGLDGATPRRVDLPPQPDAGSADIAALLAAGGLALHARHLRVTARLSVSSSGFETPILRSFDVAYTCVPME